MKAWYRESAENVLKDMGSSQRGLTQQQAEEVRRQAGENVLQEGAGKKAWQVFLEQFQDLLVIILIAAAGISMVSDNIESAVVIFAVILMNAVLGTVQHEKAQKSLDSLKSLSSPSARVIRDGLTLEILSSQVVPGDLIALEAGDLAVADGRLLECHNLQVNEKLPDGRIPGCRKAGGTDEYRRGGSFGRSVQHDFFRIVDYSGAGSHGGNCNRNAYGDRKNCSSYERHR